MRRGERSGGDGYRPLGRAHKANADQTATAGFARRRGAQAIVSESGPRRAKRWGTAGAQLEEIARQLVLIRSFQIATSRCAAGFDDAQGIRFWLKHPDKQKAANRRQNKGLWCSAVWLTTECSAVELPGNFPIF